MCITAGITTPVRDHQFLNEQIKTIMKKKNTERFVRVDNDFLNLPEIEYTIENLKGPGLAMAIMLLERLQYRKNTIGLISNLGRTARKLGVQKRTLIGMLCKCPVFRVDLKRGIFYAPRLRKKFKLSVELTDEEINDVMSNGNIYYGSGEKKAQKAEVSENDSESFSKHSRKSSSQPSDIQQKRTPYIYKDRYISHRNIEVESNSARASERPCPAVTADDKEFKKILSSDTWRRAVTMRTGIDLDDDATLAIFAEWMHDYCVSIQKRLRDDSDVRSYAASLLRRGTKTRGEFDNYATEHQKPRELTPIEPPHAEFEFIFDGMRYTKQGQLIPFDAPVARTNRQWFSYIRNRWVERSEYDEEAENAVLKRMIREIPGYVRHTA